MIFIYINYDINIKLESNNLSNLDKIIDSLKEKKKTVFDILKEQYYYDYKPKNVNISAMTIYFQMNKSKVNNIETDLRPIINNRKKNDNISFFNCFNIGMFLKLDKDKFYDIVHNNHLGEIIHKNEKEHKSFLKKLAKKKVKKNENENENLNKNNNKKKEKEKNTEFFNQVTVVVKVSDEKCINIKLFQNGSIHTTGSDNFDNLQKALEILFNELNKKKLVYNYKTRQFLEINFINTKENKLIDINDIHTNNILEINKNINIYDIENGKISLINANYYIGFRINRQSLNNLINNVNLNKNSLDNLEIKNNNNTNININNPLNYLSSEFDESTHASVNVKLKHPNKLVTIFIFESGSIIIITNNFKILNDAYNFINIFLYSNYFRIVNK